MSSSVSETSKASDEESGWEDWDEDQRRALGRSHQRTMGTLEETSTDHSRNSIHEVRSKPNPRDPKDQILPSDLELCKQEQKAKESNHREDAPVVKPVIKRERRFFTRACIIIAATAVVCVSGLISATFVLPGGKGAAAAAITGPGDSDQDTGRKADTGQDASQSERETAEEMLKSVTSAFRNAAYLVGSQITPKAVKRNDDMKFLFPDYAFASVYQENDSGWRAPDYEGLYSKVLSPLVDIQPVMWVTKRSGAFTLKDILTYCGKLVLASPAAVGHEDEDTLAIFSTPDNTGFYVNVNTDTKAGLLRAQQLGVVDSELIHVVTTPLLADASALFADKLRTGRLFALLREPVEQALSDFHHRKVLPMGDPGRLPEELMLSQFVESANLETNPLTKALANVTYGTVLTEQHVLAAKQMLHERVLVGLQGSFDESVQRFVNYFGWTIHDQICVANFEAARDHTSDHKQLSQTSQEWKTLADRNWADKEVFEFAKNVVFPNQAGLTSVST